MSDLNDGPDLTEEIADLEACGLDVSEWDFWDIFDAHGRLLADNELTCRCLADGSRIIRLERRRAEILKMSPAKRDALRERILKVLE